MVVRTHTWLVHKKRDASGHDHAADGRFGSGGGRSAGPSAPDRHGKPAASGATIRAAVAELPEGIRDDRRALTKVMRAAAKLHVSLYPKLMRLGLLVHEYAPDVIDTAADFENIAKAKTATGKPMGAAAGNDPIFDATGMPGYWVLGQLVPRIAGAAAGKLAKRKALNAWDDEKYEAVAKATRKLWLLACRDLGVEVDLPSVAEIVRYLKGKHAKSKALRRPPWMVFKGWDPGKHRRGDAENAGHFASGGAPTDRRNDALDAAWNDDPPKPKPPTARPAAPPEPKPSGWGSRPAQRFAPPTDVETEVSPRPAPQPLPRQPATAPLQSKPRAPASAPKPSPGGSAQRPWTAADERSPKGPPPLPHHRTQQGALRAANDVAQLARMDRSLVSPQHLSHLHGQAMAALDAHLKAGIAEIDRRGGDPRVKQAFARKIAAARARLDQMAGVQAAPPRPRVGWSRKAFSGLLSVEKAMARPWFVFKGRAGYDPNQPRGEHGRWARAGSEAKSAPAGPLTAPVLAESLGPPGPATPERVAAAKKLLKKHATDVAPLARHGMAEAEPMREVVVEGVSFKYHPSLEHEAARTLAELTALDPILWTSTREIVHTTQANSLDAYWAERYAIPGVQSTATGGDGAVVVYRGQSAYAAVMAHECGHNLATRMWGTTDPPVWSPYGVAQRKEPPVNDYGSKSPAEDFAEAIRKYCDPNPVTQWEFRTKFPLKKAALDEIFGRGAPTAKAMHETHHRTEIIRGDEWIEAIEYDAAGGVIGRTYFAVEAAKGVRPRHPWFVFKDASFEGKHPPEDK